MRGIKKMYHHDLSAFDLVPVGVIVAAYADLVPAVAAVFAIGWYCILIWESDTVRGWTNRKQHVVQIDDNPEDMTGL